MPDGTADPRKYIRLAALLRRRIVDGSLAVGGPTPSIAVLAAQHGARETCAKALHMLEDEGLLKRIPGLGYYVVRCPDADEPNSAS
jgi:GntR family transcriptional regulator